VGRNTNIDVRTLRFSNMSKEGTCEALEKGGGSGPPERQKRKKETEKSEISKTKEGTCEDPGCS
jgi:hypothetical protein